MFIDFSAVVKQFSGQSFKNPDEPTDDLKLWVVAINSLKLVFDDEMGLSGVEKLKRGKLAMKIYGSSILEVSSEEITLIKFVIGKAYGPEIVTSSEILLESPVINNSGSSPSNS